MAHHLPETHRAAGAPTRFPELNGLLGELVALVEGALGDDLVGAYLQGSFAVGDADRHSDCDFLVVTRGPLNPRQEARLREIPTRDGHWTHHLEGSYAPQDELRTLAGLGADWLYIDHGWREMRWSTHCNSEVVRWSLREHGVVLAGPNPRELVDGVGPDALRARMRTDLASFLPDLFTWTDFGVAWTQRYAVATVCRMLHTLHAGRVASKRASMLWAIDHLDPDWRDLIAQAVEDRELGWEPDAAPRAGSVEPTLAFVRQAAARAAADPV